LVEIGNYFASTFVQHFPKYETVYAHDPEGSYKPGDVVLAQKLPSRMTKHITHEVQEVVFKFGDVTDPVTGKKVVVGKYRYVTCSHFHKIQCSQL
jgi:ribosomal protein S17